MIRVYSNQNSTLVHHLRNVLISHSIDCVVKNDRLGNVIGGIPPSECWVELWIGDESQLQEAQGIINQVLADDETPANPWLCPKCKEEIEGQFTECWQCGTSRV